MTTTFFIVWAVILVFDGALMAWLTWAAESERFGKYRIRKPKPSQRLNWWRQTINTNLNQILSLVMYLAFFYFCGSWVFYSGWPGLTTVLGESLGVLLLYDFMYYFAHRAAHHPWGMRHVHGLHHRVRFPTATQSVFAHPAENMGGVGLLLLATLLLGPVSTTSFLVIFFVHSTVNIIVHSNLAFPHPVFRLFNFWAEKHDGHHAKIHYNYASIFPFWDQAFGTSK